MTQDVRLKSQYQTDFKNLFSGLCNSKSNWQVWSDFVTLAAISLSNALDESELREKREKQYLSIINSYKKQEGEKFPELLAIMAKALEENPEQDFLGELFMRLELGNHWKGQFFTPYHIGHFMAISSLETVDIAAEKKGYVGILDPCCGAGVLLIAARNALASKNIGFMQALYVAQDIDVTAALMCYIQLSLLGCAGYVVVGDSLSNPIVCAGSGVLPVLQEGQDIWFTPMFYSEVWRGRRMAAKMDLLLRSAKPMPAETPTQKPAESLSETKTGQLTLF